MESRGAGERRDDYLRRLDESDVEESGTGGGARLSVVISSLSKKSATFGDHALDPALQLACDQIVNEHHAEFAIVEAGNRGKVLAPIFDEDLAAFDVDFKKRFEAIGGKPRCDDNQALGTLGRETPDHRRRIGL